MEKEVCCVNTKGVINYVKKHNHGDCSALFDNLSQEIDGMTDPEVFLKDPNNWISCALAVKLYKRAREILNDDMVIYKVPKFAIENMTLGYIQKAFVKAFWSYRTALRHAQKVNDKFNRSKRVELVEIKGNGATVRLHWDDGMVLSKDLCWMNHGVYTFMPMIWGGLPLTLTESRCHFEGAPFCEYHLKWPARNWVHETISRFFTATSVLRETLAEIQADKHLIEQKSGELHRLNRELDTKIKQLQAIQQTGKAILSILNMDDLLYDILGTLSNVCHINMAIIMLVNHREHCLEYVHGIGFKGEVPEELRNYTIPLSHVSNILVRVTNTGQSEYIHDVTRSNLRKENIILSSVKPSSAYVVPLITKSKVIGVIATDAVDEGGVPRETRDVIELFAPQIAIAIENARLYRKLKDQMEELKQSNLLLNRAEKISFLGNLAARLAHEIKNPMTAIGTFIQMLPCKFDNEEFRNDFYKIAIEETDRVKNLISELLNLVKKEDTQFLAHDLCGLIEKMILLVSPRLTARKVDIVRKYDPAVGQVCIDAEKMKQVILNILSNAVEYSPDGGTIEILTRRDNNGKNNVIIEIKDKGPGISPNNMEKVFDPYFTTKHSSTIHSGTGLGLFVAYQNMQYHGGVIHVKSAPGEGSTFVLTLPAIPRSSG